MTPCVSIIVASRNTKDLLRECLKSVGRNASGAVLEVIVVDNDSSDGSAAMVAEEFPSVRLIRNDRNTGFAGANNQAMRIARGRYLLLLNSDTVLIEDTLGPMLAFLEERPEVGVAGCRLEKPDGKLDRACKRSIPTPLSSLFRFLGLDRLFPRSRLFGRYNLTYKEPEGRYEVDAVVGAFMLLRREVVLAVGGLDERFFMFGEDLDWCLRIRNAKWKVYYVGDRKAIHVKGGSTVKDPVRMNYHFHRSMFLFHRKHLVDRYPFFVNWLVYLGIGVRFLLRSFRLIAGAGRRPAVAQSGGTVGSVTVGVKGGTALAGGGPPSAAAAVAPAPASASKVADASDRMMRSEAGG